MGRRTIDTTDCRLWGLRSRRICINGEWKAGDNSEECRENCGAVLHGSNGCRYDIGFYLWENEKQGCRCYFIVSSSLGGSSCTVRYMDDPAGMAVRSCQVQLDVNLFALHHEHLGLGIVAHGRFLNAPTDGFMVARYKRTTPSVSSKLMLTLCRLYWKKYPN